MEIKEIYVDVIGYENSYNISNLGNVISLDRYVWNGKVNHIRKGESIKTIINNSGYKCVNLRINGGLKTFTIHRLVAMCFLKHNSDGTNKNVIDHIDGNKLNNDYKNLRIVTNRENLSNYKNVTSKYTGVHFHSKNKKWNANIWHNNKRIFLGTFNNEIDAHLSYQKYLKEKVLC